MTALLILRKPGKSCKHSELCPWVRNGTDGGQYWLLCAEGEVQNSKAGKIDILGNHKYTVAPPSVHPSGMLYEWIDRPGPLPLLVSIADIDFLPLQLASTVRREARVEKKHALPPVANAVLIEGYVSGYASHSEAEYAAVLSLASTGFSDEMICEIFRVHQPPHYTKKGARHFQKYTLDKAREYLKQQEKPQQQAVAIPFIEWAMQTTWAARTGNTDRAVFLALCERYQRDRTMPFRASMRELAERANLSKEAVQRSLHRLQENQIVTCAGKDKEAGSNQYRLTAETIQSQSGVCKVHTLGVTTPSVCTLHTPHDAWNNRALGQSGLFCYQQLQQQPGTVAELAQRLGKERSTVSRTLHRLEEHGLACSDGKAWKALEVTPERLDRIALLCGTAGKSAARVQKHREERATRASLIVMQQKERFIEWAGKTKDVASPDVLCRAA